jgi:tetratricopeptide (TPR) repeat protein
VVKKRLRDMFRKVKPGARERSPTDPPAPISVPAEPAVPPPVVDRSLAEYLSAAVETREAGRFDEADGLLTEAIERFPDKPRPRFDWALLPHFRLDWTEAVRRSEIVRAEFPDAPAAHVLGAIVLRELDRLDDAENLLAAARERFPDDLRLANESAWLATHRRDWLEALRRWDLVRGQFPDWPGGYTGVAMIQRELRWFGEAEATLAEAVERFPAEPEPYIDYARVAEARGDWPEAALRWELARESFPDRAAGYVGGAAALRELGRADEAEALTAEAAERFSTNATAAAEHAGTEPVPRATFDSDAASPLVSAESPETIAESATLTTEAPQPPGEVASAGRSLAEYLDAATELRAARRLDEANALLAEAMEQFRDDPDLLSESARVAEWRSDWPEAARHWEAVHNLLPGHALAHIGHARALIHDGRHDAAETLLEDAAQRFPENFEILITRADCAMRRGDWPEALWRWEVVRDRFGSNPWGYFGGGRSLLALGRAEEAEDLLVVAVSRFPNDHGIITSWAECAVHRKDWKEAAARWERVRATEPDNVGGYTAGAVALKNLGKMVEAEELLLLAQARFPDREEGFVEHAWLAHARGDRTEEADLWAAVRAQFPRCVTAYLWGAAALRELGRGDDAEDLLKIAIEQFTGDAGPLMDFARTAGARGDWTESACRWNEVIKQFPDLPTGYVEQARALQAAGDSDEATAVIARAEERFPLNLEFLNLAADLAFHRGDKQSAIRYGDKLREQYHDDPVGWFHTARALRDSGRIAETEELLADAPERFPNHLPILSIWVSLPRALSDNREAVRRSRWLLDRFPNDPGAYTHMARALLAANQAEEARSILERARRQFPGDAGLEESYGELLIHGHNWVGAAQHWKSVREGRSSYLGAYINETRALRELGRFEDAESLAAEAGDRFPNDPAPVVELAMIAHIRRDLMTAISRWRQLRERFPREIVGYTMGSLDLFNLNRDDEAEALVHDAIERFPDSAELPIEYARLAERRRRWATAIERWEQVRNRLPDRIEGYIGSALALISDGRYDEADSLLEAAHARFPQVPQIARDYAWTAYRRHRWDEAEERFALVRERFVDEPSGYLGGAAVLVSRGRLDEAEKLLEEGMARIPTDPFLKLEHARIPSSPLLRDDRNWDLAISRIEALCSEFPDFEEGHIDLVRTLRDRGRLDEAEAAGSRGLQRRKRSPNLGIEYARIAQERGDWLEALKRYATVTEQFPDQSAGFAGQAEALSHLGRFDGAEALLVRAMGSFPAEPGPYAEHARLAMRRGEPEEALRRWANAVRSFPDDTQLAQELFVARLRVAETDPIVAAAATERSQNGESDSASATATDELLPMRELVSTFESLGGTLLGCEFGLFQREFGAEPLGLLRWTDIEPDALIAALEVEFEGVGLPANTELVTPPDASAEYATRDRRFGMRMHTFVSMRATPPDQMFARVCRRLQYLRDKLLADLKSSEKVFVYKITARNLTDDELRRLHGALRRYGDNTLLYVRYADPGHPAGAVEMTEPGLLIGYVDRFAMSASGENLGAQTVAWTDICRKAYRLRASKAAGGDTRIPMPGDASSELGADPDLAACDLMMNFESLGGSGHGCEFGILQRGFGAEPLGLLRWADLAPHLLAEALEQEFEGVGLVENTILFVPPGDRPEYWTRDSRYWMAMRTFVAADATSEEQMREQVCRRLQFLRDKLIGDLRASAKIFVFKVIERNLTDQEIGRLHAAMRRYGDNTLLYVRYQDEEHPNGIVEVAADGLMIGYIDRFAHSKTDENLGPATQSWVALCKAAHALRTTHAPVGAIGNRLTSDQADVRCMGESVRTNAPDPSLSC